MFSVFSSGSHGITSLRKKVKAVIPEIPVKAKNTDSGIISSDGMIIKAKSEIQNVAIIRHQKNISLGGILESKRVMFHRARG